MPGPPPKRSDHRRRRNKVEIDAAVSDGEVRGPDLTGRHSAAGRRFWEALRRSGEAQFFEPSDWSAAELVVLAIDSFVKKPSSMMLTAISSSMTKLLVTEGDRRRVAVELHRGVTEADDDSVSELNEYRRRLSG